MRKINSELLSDYLFNEEKKEKKTKSIQEAFRAGKSQEVAEKMFRILGRRLGMKFFVSPMPTEYVNQEGKFLGYYGATAKGRKLRINFQVGGKDEIVSIDYYDTLSSTPTYTIYLKGWNIVQILDQIVDVITGEYFEYAGEPLAASVGVSKKNKDKIEERRRKSHKQMIKNWIEDNPDVMPEIRRRGTDWDSLVQQYNDYSVRNGYEEIGSMTTFKVQAAKVLKSMDSQEAEEASENIPTIEARRGQPDRPINTDQEAEQSWSQLSEDPRVIKFQMMRVYMEQVKRGNPDFQGVYVYGQGGIGKSYWAKEILEPLPETVYMQGDTIQGYTGLLSLLFENKDGKVIVLDDALTDKMLKNATIENILKNILDPDGDGHVKVSKGGNRRENINNENEKNSIQEQDGEEEEDDFRLVDFTSGEGIEGDEDKYDFYFTSRLVILTNYQYLPQALDDRVWMLEMVFDNFQILDLIDEVFMQAAPGATNEDAETVFNFMSFQEAGMEDKGTTKEFMKGALEVGAVGKQFSLRLYKRLVSIYLAVKGLPNWRDFLMVELS